MISINYRTRPAGSVRIGGGGAKSQIDEDTLYNVYKSLQLRVNCFSTADIRACFTSVLESTGKHTVDPTQANDDVRYIDVNDNLIDSFKKRYNLVKCKS